MICHGVVYSPDVFRVSALPDETIREILPYGACNPGNDAFPKELLTVHGIISEESPFGKALIGAKEGQEVIVEAPFGNIHYTVAKIER